MEKTERETIKYCLENREILKQAPAIKLRQIMKDNEFCERFFIRALHGIGIHSLDPQTQIEHNRIFGTGDGFGGHIYGDNHRTE